jgi:hypothetical protein
MTYRLATRQFSIFCLLGLLTTLPTYALNTDDDISEKDEERGNQTVSRSSNDKPAKQQRCKVSGIEAIAEAKQRGFQFEIAPSEGSVGQCHDELDYAIVVAAAADDGEGITCQVTYFKGKKLSSGWLLMFPNFAHNFDYLEEPAAGTGSPTFKVKFSAARGDTSQLRLEDLVLAGDDCESWKDAFALSTD